MKLFISFINNFIFVHKVAFTKMMEQSKSDIYNKLDLSDKNTFSTIYKKYAILVYRVAFHFSMDEEWSKDIVQDIFSSLWQRRHELHIHGEIENYLVRCAKMQIAKHIREKAVRDRQERDFSGGESIKTSFVDENLIFSDTKKAYEKLLDRLPEKTRTIFELSRNSGLTNLEIASKLGISHKTVEYHISTTLKRLKKFLK